MQRELPLIGLLKAPDAIRDDVLRSFGDDEEDSVLFAVRWAWDHRRVKMSQNQAAAHCGLTSSHLCNILSGQKYLPPHKINAFEWLCGNHAISQTIQRFAAIRENEQTRQFAEVIAQNITRSA